MHRSTADLELDGPGLDATRTPSPVQVVGDALGYWDFFPTGEPGWGCVPAMGWADVVASATRTVIVGHGVSGAVVRGLNLGLDARAMFVLEKPQDAFFRLLAGREERIVCD